MNKSNIIMLKMLGLPVIEKVDDFAELTRLSRSIIYQMSKFANEYYITYQLPKKTGGKRTISQPSRKLKALQAWILVNILNKLSVSSSCMGFEKGTSTYQNAKAHIGATTILTVDIQDFFPSISQRHVFNIFRAVGYNKLISIILSKICTFEDKLPQGGPCSPKLANLAAWRLDNRLQGYVGKKGISYTRYADDLSFSGPMPSKVVRSLPFIKRILTSERFEVNDKKTRIAGPSRAKIVTGLVVGNDGVGIGRDKYKVFRAKIHRLTKQTEQTNFKLLSEVHGWLAYLHSVDVKRLNKAKKYIANLKSKYPESLVSKLNWK